MDALVKPAQSDIMRVIQHNETSPDEGLVDVNKALGELLSI